MAEATVSNIAVISRAAAKVKGLRRYFTGKACKYGHIAERDIRHKACLACQSQTWLDQRVDRFVLADDGIMRKVISRTTAKTTGLNLYFTGKPCKHGHLSERFAAGNCCRCTEISAEVNREHLRTYNREYARYLRLRRGMRPRKPNPLSREQRRVLLAGRPCPDQCEICGEHRKVRFDHCHATGNFRGWICNRCNLTLGNVQDNSSLLRKLADYLEHHINANRQIDWVRMAEVKTLLSMRP
jgi:hypothetical protein